MTFLQAHAGNNTRYLLSKQCFCTCDSHQGPTRNKTIKLEEAINRSPRAREKTNVPTSHLKLHEVTQGAHDLDDLLGKLAGRREHERLALRRGGVDLLEDRHGEGGGLTGTCDNAT